LSVNSHKRSESYKEECESKSYLSSQKSGLYEKKNKDESFFLTNIELFLVAILYLFNKKVWAYLKRFLDNINFLRCLVKHLGFK
jgi:hypothetical protein